MSYKLIIAHLHVWDKKNKGDLAIVQAAQFLLKKHIFGVKIIDYPVHLLKGQDLSAVKKINQADLVIIGGGGIFYRWFLPFHDKFITQIKKPIVIYGVGYIREEGAPRLTKQEKQSIKYLCARTKLIGVRDYYTKNFITRLGIIKQKIKVIGDPAIFLPETRTDKYNLKPNIKIGININYSGWLGFGQYQAIILKSFKQLAEYFQAHYHAEIYYLEHHPDEAIIRSKLKINNLKVVNLPPRQQKFIYSQLNLVVGMMLHSCVLTFGALTPEINLAYDIRNKSFAKFIGHPELIITPSDLNDTTLLKKALKIFKNEKFYRQRFLQRKKTIWQKHHSFLKELEKLFYQCQ